MLIVSTIVGLSEISLYGLKAIPTILWPILNPKNQNPDLLRTPDLPQVLAPKSGFYCTDYSDQQ